MEEYAGKNAGKIGNAYHRQIDAASQHGNHHGNRQNAKLRHDVGNGLKIIVAQELVRIQP
ncbi:hypothetical protein QFZ34_003212 [Phyllobacterium ifriqiyense]|uniref:Uncharacterized protein n=1 Tax=Phyllobacterium ifriqiyense TaxID=314238 RepID=A0ABU0SB86_9HYPH|nr:hypothetical protein [Phyllobacterium ifriqiyense]MDQ0998030.1 hypothetical protein [Phyllobacterium ifriqiyense]